MSRGNRGGGAVRYAIIGAASGAVAAIAFIGSPDTFAIAAFAAIGEAIGMIVELIRRERDGS
ncbi:MAG: hypothetical protein H0U65_08695 [Rubrobacter sp.]|jgi:hypothetical protein|nr:hypothetical protein [Rubrobacter sp.]